MKNKKIKVPFIIILFLSIFVFAVRYSIEIKSFIKSVFIKNDGVEKAKLINLENAEWHFNTSYNNYKGCDNWNIYNENTKSHRNSDNNFNILTSIRYNSDNGDNATFIFQKNHNLIVNMTIKNSHNDYYQNNNGGGYYNTHYSTSNKSLFFNYTISEDSILKISEINKPQFYDLYKLRFENKRIYIKPYFDDITKQKAKIKFLNNNINKDLIAINCGSQNFNVQGMDYTEKVNVINNLFNNLINGPDVSELSIVKVRTF